MQRIESARRTRSRRERFWVGDYDRLPYKMLTLEVILAPPLLGEAALVVMYPVVSNEGIPIKYFPYFYSYLTHKVVY